MAGTSAILDTSCFNGHSGYISCKSSCPCQVMFLVCTAVRNFLTLPASPSRFALVAPRFKRCQSQLPPQVTNSVACSVCSWVNLFSSMLYQRLLSAFAGAAAVHSVVASPLDGHRVVGREIPSTHVLHERQMPQWSRTWQKKDRVPKSALLPMRIGLRQTNLQEGHELLMDRSDPRSPNYGLRMSAREVIDFFAPPRESVEVVRDWLVAGGINVTRLTQSANKQVTTLVLSSRSAWLTPS